MHRYTIEDETGMIVATATTIRELRTKFQAGTKVFRSQIIRDDAGNRISSADLDRLAS